MTADLAEQRTTLERELGNLDALLASDPDWMVFCSLEASRARAEGGLPSQRDAAWRQIRAKLSSNRIFCARERIVEAIALVCEELERRRPEVGAKASVPAQDAAETAEEDDGALSDREVGVAPVVVETVVSPGDAASCSSAPCMMSQLGNQMSLGSDPHGLVDQRTGLSDDKAQILSRGRAKVRVQTKVAIRLRPPDGTAFGDDPAVGPDDNLAVIRGISAETAGRLNGLGVRRYRQIAVWSARDVASVRAALGLGSKITSENWIEQAALLEGRVESVGAVPEPSLDPERRGADGRETGAKPISQEAVSTPQAASSKLSAVAAASAAISARLGAGVTNERDALSEPALDCVAMASAAIFKDLGAFSPPRPDEAQPAREDEPVCEQEFTGERLSQADGAQLPDTLSDALNYIRGIDSSLADRLISAGTTHYCQIAQWTASDIARLSVGLELGQKITREAWVEQAAVLAGGASSAYSRHVESGFPMRSGALIDWDIRVEPRERDRSHESDTDLAGAESSLDEKDFDVSVEASGPDVEPVVVVQSPPPLPLPLQSPLPLPLPEIAVPAQNRDIAQQAFVVDEDLGEQDFGEADVEIVAARGLDEKSLDGGDFGEAEIEIVVSRGDDDAVLEGDDFGEAEIEIVAGRRAPLPERGVLLEHSHPRNLGDEALIKIVPVPEDAVGPPAHAQADDAFDADDYAGYNGDVNEASVSIILNGEEGASGSIAPMALSATPASRHHAFDPLAAKKPLVE